MSLALLRQEAIAAMMVDVGLEWQEAYDLRTYGLRLFAVPLDPDGDHHLRWDGVEWQLEQGPMSTGASHWWRGVRLRARRYGLRLPMTCIEAALDRWGDGMAAGHYCTDYLEADLGVPEEDRVIPTLAALTSGGPCCTSHLEPLPCMVEGCPQ